ncbi:hypothetical protein BDV98DRAFT_482272, partial [Pterulicium gracile]
CPDLGAYPQSELIVTCQRCNAYSVVCCQHTAKQSTLSGRVCHHRKVSFTDGACSRNGAQDTTAGIGVAMGTAEDQHMAIPIDDTVEINRDARRTSQRAELLAAMEGVRKLLRRKEDHEEHYHPSGNRNQGQGSEYIIGTDFEYVVLDMSDWLPAWKVS